VTAVAGAHADACSTCVEVTRGIDFHKTRKMQGPLVRDFISCTKYEYLTSCNDREHTFDLRLSFTSAFDGN
jgi:hypothetical protein